MCKGISALQQQTSDLSGTVKTLHQTVATANKRLIRRVTDLEAHRFASTVSMRTSVAPVLGNGCGHNAIRKPHAPSTKNPDFNTQDNVQYYIKIGEEPWIQANKKYSIQANKLIPYVP
jgi:hypothetical protein